ncbi:MAG: class I tRNA ligase family protein, partial [Patescibacteria group bacterium]
MSDPTPEKAPKSTHAEREERILSFWKDKAIFEKTLEKNKGKKEFIFYEGPPTANGRPGLHHIEPRAFKDAIPRYKTMQGFYVRRRGGWDTHGLPVELQVEKELGLKSKKEIETFGIAAFNEKCKESVWKYVREWEEYTTRIGYWVDLKNPYITYKPKYIESLWNIMKTVEHKKLLYKDYKVVPWCPRCGTGLSSHELAQGYEDVKDLSVTVKFGLVDEPGTFLLAWTTTPWTLPGNVALAVGPNVEYSKVKTVDGIYILATNRLAAVFKDSTPEIIASLKGSDLVGKSYKPLYTFLVGAINASSVAKAEKEKLTNAFKVYAADFVTTADGTGIVHIAPMYGQDDFELGTKNNLPKYHLVNDDGTFKKETGFLAGKFVKGEGLDVEIIKDLAGRPDGNLLFDKEKYAHSYPFCWRCHTPLIYFARDSWYIRMSSLRDELVKENEKINWEPSYIKEGRFGEWLREVKDWAISRERYWGTPLPIWSCGACHSRKVVGSIEEITQKPKNEYWVMRHGQAENNVEDLLSSDLKKVYHLTPTGKLQAAQSAEQFKKIGIDYIFVSPLMRTQETAAVVAEKLGLKPEQVITDERLHELRFGEWEGRKASDFVHTFPFESRFELMPNNGEKYGDVKKRVGDFLYEIESKYQGKKILVVTHGGPGAMHMAAAL